MMLHAHGDMHEARYVGGGIYVGGMADAVNRIRSGELSPRAFKFIFNYVQWAPGELQHQLDLSQWQVTHVPTRLVLRQDNQQSDSLWCVIT
jgi:putative AlgH/UPF0301 family transcriptional regulator